MYIYIYAHTHIDTHKYIHALVDVMHMYSHIHTHIHVQTTSIIGHLNKPSLQALIHGLNRHYYSIAISYRKNELEEKMLMNLHKKGWTQGLKTAGMYACVSGIHGTTTTHLNK